MTSVLSVFQNRCSYKFIWGDSSVEFSYLVLLTCNVKFVPNCPLCFCQTFMRRIGWQVFHSVSFLEEFFPMFEWSLLSTAPSSRTLTAALPEIYSSGVQWNVNLFIIAVTIHFSLSCFPVPSTSELNSWLVTAGK